MLGSMDRTVDQPNAAFLQHGRDPLVGQSGDDLVRGERCLEGQGDGLVGRDSKQERCQRVVHQVFEERFERRWRVEAVRVRVRPSLGDEAVPIAHMHQAGRDRPVLAQRPPQVIRIHALR